MKKPRLVTIFSLILILAGLGLTAYPIISNILAQKNASEAIEDYDDQIQDMDEEKIDAVKESMKQYNQQLGHAVVQDETSEAVKEAAEAAGNDGNTDADGTDTEGSTHTTMMEIGDVIVHDIVHTGVDVVATKKIRVNTTKKYLYKEL